VLEGSAELRFPSAAVGLTLPVLWPVKDWIAVADLCCLHISPSFFPKLKADLLGGKQRYLKNAFFWDKRTQYLPHRKHIKSLLQNPAR
jgi:hypothetical protein